MWGRCWSFRQDYNSMKIYDQCCGSLMLLYSKLWVSTCKVKKRSSQSPSQDESPLKEVFTDKKDGSNLQISTNQWNIYILLYIYIYILILHCALLQNNLFFGNKLCFLIYLNFAASFPNLCLPAQLPNNSPCVFPLPQLLAWWAATAELQRKDHPCDYRWDLSTASHAMPWDTL